MDTTPSRAVRYDRRSIAVHWTTAALVVALWALGQTIDWLSKGTPRLAARSPHITLGVALALALTHRIWWRLGAGARLPPAGARWLDSVAALTHKLLYLLLVTTGLLGWVIAWVRGDTVFNLFTIPAFDAGNKALRRTMEEWHALAASTLVVVAALHAAAGLLHDFLWKDGALRRMLPLRPPR
jgi:cytochrome b561